MRLIPSGRIVGNNAKQGYEMTAEYQACRYKGTEWGIWSNSSRNWIVFGKKADMIERAKQLNKEARK